MIKSDGRCVEDFLRYMADSKRSKTNTLEAYGRDLRQLEEYLDLPPEEATTTVLMAYVLRLHKNGNHPATISRKIAVIKNFYRYLYYERVIGEDPAFNLKHPRFAREDSGDALSEIDKMKLRSTIIRPGMCQKDVRDCAITVLIFSTGIKASELISLNVQDYDSHARRLTYRQDTKVIPEILLEYDLGELMSAYKDTYRAKILRGAEHNARDLIGEPLFLNMHGYRLTRQGVWKIVREYGRQLELSSEISPRILELVTKE